MVRRYFDRHFPALWWTYPRSGYRIYDPSTYHLHQYPHLKLRDSVRMAAGYFWWCFLWGAVWVGVASVARLHFGLPLWPSVLLFVLGSWEGRMHKEQRRALAELRHNEAQLALSREPAQP